MEVCGQQVQKKHEWVKPLYKFWWRLVNTSEEINESIMWNYDKNIIHSFIVFLGLEARYKYNTIKNVIIASLKRIFKEKFIKDIPLIKFLLQ